VLTVNQLLMFLPAALLVSLSPGPNNLLAFRNGIHTGTRSAVAALLGRLVAFAGMLTLVVAGLSAVLTASQTVFEILKWVGATYLVAVGIHIVWKNRRAVRPPREAAGEIDDIPVAGAVGLAAQEFMTAAANPKALLVFTAFLPQFVSPGAGHTASQLAVLGVVYLGVEAAAATVWIIGGHWLARRQLPGNTMRRINRSFGLIFIGLGGGLALSTPDPTTSR
jgi:threonine/homoserine/homoserine lactone efflux protein